MCLLTSKETDTTESRHPSQTRRDLKVKICPMKDKGVKGHLAAGGATVMHKLGLSIEWAPATPTYSVFSSPFIELTQTWS